MGVLPPEEEVEAFLEEPSTPPGLRGHATEENSEDDLFSDTGTTTKTTPVFNFDHDLAFRSILPAKGVFEDFLGGRVGGWDAPNEKKKYCGKCFEDVKRDLKKLAAVVDAFKSERDAARKESEVLKKEVETLKKLLMEKDAIGKGDVKVNISNGAGNVDVLVRNKNFSNEIDTFNNNNEINNKTSDKGRRFGILSFSISLPKDKSSLENPLIDGSSKEIKKKTVTDLRREFFEKEFESEQSTFTSRNYIEIQPEQKKETFRSKLNIRVKPKKKITEIISKLTSRIFAPKVIPEPTPISMFQRFEKSRTVWVSELEEQPIA